METKENTLIILIFIYRHARIFKRSLWKTCTFKNFISTILRHDCHNYITGYT